MLLIDNDIVRRGRVPKLGEVNHQLDPGHLIHVNKTPDPLI